MSQRALLVGINNFLTLPDNGLRGCVNDTVQMHDLLTRLYSYTDDEIRILCDGEARADDIRAGLHWLFSDYDGNDVRVFHFSSHGTQAPDQAGDELDAADEVIVPADHDWDRPFRDDELREFFEAVPEGVNLTYVADCCHSGTIQKVAFDRAMTGQIDFRARYVVPPAAVRREIDQKLRQRQAPEQTIDELVNLLTSGALTVDQYKARLRDYFGQVQHKLAENRFDVVDENRHFLLAACQDRQTAADAFIDGDYHGAMTWALHKAATEAQGNITYGDLVARIGGLLKDYEQRPQLECPAALRNVSLFSALS